MKRLEDRQSAKQLRERLDKRLVELVVPVPRRVLLAVAVVVVDTATMGYARGGGGGGGGSSGGYAGRRY
jgi:uncharacterized membrane protein